VSTLRVNNLTAAGGTGTITVPTANDIFEVDRPFPAGLVLLGSATFAAVTSFSLPDNTFSSTFNNYKFILHVTATVSTPTVTMQFRAAGSDISTADYRFGFVGLTTGGTASNSSNNSGTSIAVAVTQATGRGPFVTLDIMGPFLAGRTAYLGQISFMDGTNTITRNGGGQLNLDTQIDSLTVTSSVASSLTGSYQIYGYVR